MRPGSHRTVAADPCAPGQAPAGWAQHSAAEEAERRARALALTPAQRLRLGEALSAQALKLLAAAIGQGHGPAGALPR